jgi:uncharacterized protein YciW
MSEVMNNVVQPYVRGALELALGNVEGAKEFHQKLVVVLAEKETEQDEPGVIGQDNADNSDKRDSVAIGDSNEADGDAADD